MKGCCARSGEATADDEHIHAPHNFKNALHDLVHPGSMVPQFIGSAAERFMGF